MVFSTVSCAGRMISRGTAVGVSVSAGENGPRVPLQLTLFLGTEGEREVLHDAGL